MSRRQKIEIGQLYEQEWTVGWVRDVIVVLALSEERADTDDVDDPVFSGLVLLGDEDCPAGRYYDDLVVQPYNNSEYVWHWKKIS